MELHLSPETETRVLEAAARTGRAASQIVEEAVERMLDYDTRFIEAVNTGRAAARDGNLLEHNTVVERIEHLLRK
jgi:predicted transcriptional regulator